MYSQRILPLSRFLLLILLLSPFLFNFQPEEYPIPPQIKNLLDRAEIHRCQFNFDSTVILLQEAQSVYRKMNKEKEAVEMYGRILYIYPETEMADEKGNEALLAEAQKALDKLNPNNKATIQNLIDLGRIRYIWVFELGLDKLKSLSDKIAQNAHKDKDWDLLAAVYTETAHAYQYSADENKTAYFNEYSQKAVRLIEKNLKAHHKEKAHLYYYYPYYLYYAYSNEGSRYNELKDYENALSYYKKTIKEALEPQLRFDSLLFSTTYNSIAFLYVSKGDHLKASEYFQYAIAYTADRFPHAFANYYAYLGESLSHLGQDLNAIENYLKSLHFNELSNSSPEDQLYMRVYMYQQLLVSYSKTNQLTKAQEVLTKLEALPASKDYFGARTFSMIGFYYRYAKEYNQAIHYFQKAIETYNPKSIHNGFCYWNLGQIEMEQKNYEKALLHFQKAISYEVSDFEEKNYKNNPKLDNIGDKHRVVNYLIDKLGAMRELAREKDALTTYSKSILELSNLTLEVFEEVRNSYERESSKRDLLQAAYAIYEQTIGVHLDLYAQNKNPQHLHTAFELSERSKSVLLMDALKESNALSFAGIPDSLVSREVELSNNIAFYRQQIFYTERRKDTVKTNLYKKYLFESSEALDALKTRLEKDFPNYYQLKYQASHISVDALQRALPADAAMIEYFEGKRELFVFVLYKGEIKSHRLPHSKTYTEDIKTLYDALTDMSAISKNPDLALSIFRENSQKFYANYVAAYLPKEAKQLLFVPDGMLCYIPFEALLTEESVGNNDFETLPYLLQRYNVSYHYSAMLWLEQLSRPSNTKPLNLMAMAASYEEKNAVDKYSNERVRSVRDGLLPIPGALEEVAGLQNKFGGNFLSADAADELGFKENAHKYGIIHLAMHGIVDDQHPEYSGLVFTDNPQNAEDDLLHAYEIKSMKLHAELVVLSACETGYGKYQHGEGVASLGRGFMYAGAPSVVMTLWKLHDQSSVLLIESFYDYLAQGLPKDQALRQAKLDYMKNNMGPTAHPAFWAAFVQLGDTRPISIAKKSTGLLGVSGLGWALGVGGILLVVAVPWAARRKRG